MVSRATWGSNSSSGRHLGPPFSTESETLANTAAVVASETEVGSSSGESSPTPAPTLPRCQTLVVPPEGGVLPQSHPPGRRHADDTLLNFASSVASSQISLYLADTGQYPIRRGGNKRLMLPRSTDANIPLRYTRPSCECSRASRTHHIVYGPQERVRCP